MFKNVVVYRIASKWEAPSLETLENVLPQLAFEPCLPSQEESAGWVHPRPSDNTPLVERIGGQFIFKLLVERKSVPASAVNQEVDARIKEMERATGMKVPKKAKKDLKEDVCRELLARAFPKKGSHFVWLDPVNKFLVVEAGSHRAADLVVNKVMETFTGANAPLLLAPLETNQSPAASMSHWLTSQEAPYNFTVDQELELRDTGESQAAVRYTHHNLDLDEIVAHIAAGKAPTQLALTWAENVSFTLTADFCLKKVVLHNAVFKSTDPDGDFEGMVALTTAELQGLLPDLLEALGGEKKEAESATPETEAL